MYSSDLKHLEEAGLARAVATNEPNFVPGHHGERCVFHYESCADFYAEISHLKHCSRLASNDSDHNASPENPPPYLSQDLRSLRD